MECLEVSLLTGVMFMGNPQVPFLPPPSCHVSSPPVQGESFSDVTILSGVVKSSERTLYTTPHVIPMNV